MKGFALVQYAMRPQEKFGNIAVTPESEVLVRMRTRHDNLYGAIEYLYFLRGGFSLKLKNVQNAN